MIPQEWNIQRVTRHLRWLERRKKPDQSEIKMAKDRIHTLSPNGVKLSDGKERLHQLIGLVRVEMGTLTKQVEDMQKSGGCSGCKKKSLRFAQEKLRFYTDIETELKKNL